ncbi:MAG: hypothetical protein QOE86_3684 [Solirubrobacteraceae bacterium]|jgi:hypothetical protein|nr:hypothetical protein [Solirubrobacteraceae bacterium]
MARAPEAAGRVALYMPSAWPSLSRSQPRRKAKTMRKVLMGMLTLKFLRRRGHGHKGHGQR